MKLLHQITQVLRPLEGQTKTSQTATRQFRFRYGLVLVLTALLFALSYLLLLRSLDKQADFVTQINTIGHQNALSQEITKWALALRSCEEENNCRTQMGKLQLALQKFKDTQGQLIRQHTLLKAEGLHNPTLDSILLVNYRVSYQHILQASQALMRLTEVEIQVRQKRLRPQASLRHNLSLNTNKLLFREQTLTRNSALVARLYDQETLAYIQRIKTYQTMVLVVAFIILSLEALVFFPQIARRIRSALAELEKAHEEAQSRNCEITEAHRQLQLVKEKERQDAEALRESHARLLAAQEKLTVFNQELIEKNKKLEKTDALIKANQALEAARYFDFSLNKFSEIMRWRQQQTLFSWSSQLLDELVPYLEVFQGCLYVFDPDKDNLMMTASYAHSQEFQIERLEIEIGDQLIGQAAKSRKPLLRQDLNGDATAYQGQTAIQTVEVQSVFILPLVYNDQLAGVLELSHTQPFAPQALQLLEKMAPSIAANLNALQDQKRISQLFGDSQMAQRRLRESLRKIQENEERFRKLSEVTQEGLLFLNGALIKDLNSVMLRMLGYDKADELLNRPYIQLIAPQYRFEIEEKNLLQQGHSHETLAIRKNGEILPIEIQAREVRYQEEEMRVISMRDITERKKTEQQLREANRIAKLVGELEKKNKDITSSIEYAQRIQEAILPSDKLIGKGFLQHFVFYQPKDIVSGDFYWYAEKNEYAYIAAVDCTGHGVPGAFMSIIGYSNLNKIVLEQGITEPEIVLTRLDREVSEVLKQKEENSQSRDGMDLAFCALNIFEKRLSFAGAYRPMFLFREGELHEFKGNAFPIGGNFKYKKKKIFTQQEILLREGDTIYLFSDGFADQFGGPENRKYASKRFKDFLQSLQPYHLDEQKQRLQQEFINWRGTYRQMDDVLIIGLRF